MKTLLVINLPVELEEDLVDFLLANEEVEGFTSFPVRGHGEHQGMTVAEQVSGRKKRLQFETIISEELTDSLTDGLSDVGKGIRYWLIPIIQFGST